MLCYRSTRTVGEVTHDTFFWLASQRKLWRALLPLCIIVAAAGLLCLSPNTDDMDISGKDAYYDDFDRLVSTIIGERLWSNVFNPLCIGEYFTFPGGIWIYYTALAFVTALVLTPLLVRYFLYMHSLSRLTPRRLLEQMRQYARQSVIVAAMVAAFVLLLFVLPPAFDLLTVPVLVILFFWLVPCVIMDIKPRWPGRPGAFLLSSAVICVLASLVSTVPLIAYTIIDMILGFFSDTLPIIDNYSADSPLVMLLMKVFLSISYCAALSVMLTASVIIHGTVYPQYSDN